MTPICCQFERYDVIPFHTALYGPYIILVLSYTSFSIFPTLQIEMHVASEDGTFWSRRGRYTLMLVVFGQMYSVFEMFHFLTSLTTLYTVIFCISYQSETLLSVQLSITVPKHTHITLQLSNIFWSILLRWGSLWYLSQCLHHNSISNITISILL